MVLLAGLVCGCTGPPASTVVSTASDPAVHDRSSRQHRVSSFASTTSATPGQNIRVGLLVDQARVEIAALANFEITGMAEDEAEGDGLLRVAAGPFEVDVESGQLICRRNGEVLLRSSAMAVRLSSAAAGARWRAKGNEYAGDLLLLRRGRALNLVNRLPMEEYLRGVVPWEIGRPGEDAFTAVEAQAIAARTYAYAHLAHWEEQGFDLYDSVADQVYRGLSGVSAITDRAVRATRQEVAVYHGRLIRAYYFSTSGGHTATLTDVWTREGTPYLVGRRDADAAGHSWCAESPHFRWTEAWSAHELGDIVRANLPRELDRDLNPYEIGILDSLEVHRRDPSGRVQVLRIHTDRGHFDVWGDRIRWVLRPARGRFDILRSTLFSLQNIRRDGRLVGVVAHGGGFGHGVGLCQSGAIARARAGQSAAEILRAYYPGVEIRDVRRLRGIPGQAR